MSFMFKLYVVYDTCTYIFKTLLGHCAKKTKRMLLLRQCHRFKSIVIVCASAKLHIKAIVLIKIVNVFVVLSQYDSVYKYIPAVAAS